MSLKIGGGIRMLQNNSKMKRKACHVSYEEDFTMEEYEVCETLLSLKKLKKTHRDGKKCCKRTRKNNIHSKQNLNVMKSKCNLPDLPPFQSLNNYHIIISECSKPFEKQLTDSDLKENQNRLFLSKGHMKTYFLPLLREDEDVKEGIPIIAYDMHGNMFSMTFKLWADKYYVLMGGWKAFFQAHTLGTQDYIAVWMFRHSETNNLCFALSIREGMTKNV